MHHHSYAPHHSDHHGPPRFRPLALPQITYGDGQPFMRGYSDELRDYNISPDAFFAVVDRINIAIIPNPENQIFQKAAGIAGFFVPGSAALGLKLGQLAAGIGAGYGHGALVQRAFAKANMEVFLPHGLELTIGNSQVVDQEVGFSSPQSSKDQPSGDLGLSPEARIAAYGNALAPITIAAPPVNGGGRTDALASMGASMTDKKNRKAMEKAQKKMAKGKYKKSNKLEATLQWLIVRKARPETLAQSQNVVQQTDAALQQQQADPRYAPQQQGDPRYAPQQRGDPRYAPQQYEDPRYAPQQHGDPYARQQRY